MHPTSSTLMRLLLPAASALLAGGHAGATTYVAEIVNAPTVPLAAGQMQRMYCVGLTAARVSACNVQVIETRIPSQVDRFGGGAKVFASYVYRWDLQTGFQLLSSLQPDTMDVAYAINSRGDIGGTSGNKRIKPQATVWPVAGGTTVYGPGTVTDLNTLGDVVANGKLIRNGVTIEFPGTTVVQSVNDSGRVFGTQVLGRGAGEAGLGPLYFSTPTLGTGAPLFPLSGTPLAGVGVTHSTDNGNFAVSGIPGTPGGVNAGNCQPTACQSFRSFLVTGTSALPWTVANSVNSSAIAVGSDGGIAKISGLPTLQNPGGTWTDLASLLQIPYAYPFLGNATAINDEGIVIGFTYMATSYLNWVLRPLP